MIEDEPEFETGLKDEKHILGSEDDELEHFFVNETGYDDMEKRGKVDPEEARQVLETNVHGEKVRDVELNLGPGAVDDRPEDVKEAERLLQENVYGEKVNPIRVDYRDGQTRLNPPVKMDMDLYSEDIETLDLESYESDSVLGDRQDDYGVDLEKFQNDSDERENARRLLEDFK